MQSPNFARQLARMDYHQRRQHDALLNQIDVLQQKNAALEKRIKSLEAQHSDMQKRLAVIETLVIRMNPLD